VVYLRRESFLQDCTQLPLTSHNIICCLSIHGKNEEFYILLDIDLKLILMDHQNNFVGILKLISNVAKNVDILATSLSVLHNYFDSLTKLLL